MYEKKRWVSALRAFEQARKNGEAFPIFFSDARACSDLVFAGVISDMKVTEAGTYYSFAQLHGLRDCFTQDLVLVSEKRNIAPDYIRPYAMVMTPSFLDEAKVDAAERLDQQERSYLHDVDWESAEALRPLKFEIDEDSEYVLDPDGDLSRWPAVRRRGQVLQKVAVLGMERHDAFHYFVGHEDDVHSIYRAPITDAGKVQAPAPRLVKAPPTAPKPSKVAPKAPALTMFSWGYEGWGSSLDQLFAVTAAAERSRGYEPPVFVDARFSRSVRAPGFRERTFQNALAPDRYHWMKGLGNQGIGDGGGMRIFRPEEAATLVNLAVEEAKRSRRVIFFCSCGAVDGCHRNLVRELVLAEARRKHATLEVAEWPGGTPAAKPVCTVEFSPKELSKILSGAPRIPISEELALGPFAAMPWGGYVSITDGARHATMSISPAMYSAGRWFVLPVVSPVEEGDTVDDLSVAVERFREEDGYKVFRTESR